MRDLPNQLRRYGWQIATALVAIAVTIVALVLLLEPAAKRVTRARSAAVARKATSSTPSATKRRRVPAAAGVTKTARTPLAASSQHGSTAPAKARPPAVGMRIVQLFDASRGRALPTIVRYPASGRSSAPPLLDAHPKGGPYPLIVFGHGFAVTPAPYGPLLDAWTRAGYVVAAPIFPKSNPNAPGGPNEQDLPKQAGDMNFVIDKMLELSAANAGPFAALISSHVAVAGQSDGGDTALAAAFDPAAHYLPIEAAVILSGAEDPFAPAFQPQAGTPLLATQGTADTINPPASTFTFFRAASPPKYLLLLEGAGHQEPYTVQGSDLDAVAHISIAFLNRYLKLAGAALQQYVQQGNAGAGTTLQATP